MNRLKSSLLCALSLVLGSGAVSFAQPAAPSVRLAYPVTSHNTAREPVLTSPGATGTAFALRLTVSGTDWARWNLPRSEAHPTAQSLTFYARAVGKSEGFTVRLVEEDGSEWHAPRQAVGPQWHAYRFQAADFRYYRSRDSREGTPLNMGRVTQIHLVLSGHAEGTGIEVDEVALEPGGRRFTFETAEQRMPIPPAEARRERLGTVLAALNAERQLVARQREWARRCAADLGALLADRRPGETYAAFAARQAQRPGGFAFQAAPPTAVAPYTATPVSAQLLNERARALARPARELTMEPAAEWSANALYAAATPAPPVPVNEGARSAVRLAARFSGENQQQVVFLNTAPFAPLNVRGAELEVEMRLGSGPLDERMPLVLRLWTNPQGRGPEAWADILLPDFPSVARGQWTTVRFPLARILRGVAFDPESVRALSFRLQNVPGKPAALDLDIARMRLVMPDPESLAAEEMRAKALSGLNEDRLALWRDLETLHAARRRAWADPLVQRFVLRAQLQPAPVAEAASVSDPLASLPSKIEGGIPARLDARASLEADGTGRVIVRWQADPAGLSGHAVLLDHSGKPVAAAPLAAEKTALTATLTLPRPRRWSPSYPYLYQVKTALLRDSRPVALERKEVGFRIITAGPGDVTAALRHAWAPAPWEGGLKLNGQPFFPNGAHFQRPIGARLTALAPVLHDLWVDALRDYGWTVRPDDWAEGDREGIGTYAAVAPAYGSLKDSSDLKHLMADHADRLRVAGADLWHPSVLNWQVGNEVELTMWGADLGAAFPEASWLPLENALHTVRAGTAPAPLSYVRAGSFTMPILPGEDVVGVNQYTGRYGGRIEQIAAHLDLFGRWCQAAGRPLGLTEWNGPQYSWAASGIGGVTERGAAYYVQRYWDAMVDTPAMALSSEFTLNWVLWRVEDLTNRSRAEEWQDRPPYAKFGGGHSADHIPRPTLDKFYRGEPYRALQAVHSPLYPLARTPGRVVVGYAADARPLAEKLAGALSSLGKETALRPLDASFNPEQTDAHLILVGGVGAAQPAAIRRLEREGWLDATLADFPAGDRPLVQRRVHPYFPTRGLISVTGATVAARAEGVRHLAVSAEALRELWAREGAMVRAVALTDDKWVPAYERLLFEFVGRGHLWGGDDTRARLDALEFLDAQGKRRAQWWNLHALVLDTARALEPSELDTVRRLARQGVRVVVSLPCYNANPALQRLLSVRVGAPRSLTGAIEPDAALRGPVPVNSLGGISTEVIQSFRPGSDLSVLEARELEAPGAAVLARATESGRPVAVRVNVGEERYSLLGYGIGALAELHRRVATGGRTHGLYDRDTASGLERPGRFALNALLEGAPEPRVLPRLRGVARVEDAFLKPGARSNLTVRLFDTEGRPQSGASVRVRGQVALEAKPAGTLTDPVDMVEVAPGVYRCPVAIGGASTPGTLTVAPPRAGREGLHALSVQIRATAPDRIAWEGGASAWLQP